ncbi:MAG: hypothetical protein LBT45_00280 [Rickettsiales bacterium]|jgi:hypothetical protein|nr:hypothetical protein [Rickettsiales bacterium]
MKKALAVFFLLAGCNAVSIKPHSLDKTKLFYADRGGYTMKFAIKEELEARGYKIIVGKSNGTVASGDSISLTSENLMNARYVVKVDEKEPTFSPVLCIFNGFWWWRFNVSIADQKTGEELLAWTGRGCVNGSLRRLRRFMDRLEKNDNL